MAFALGMSSAALLFVSADELCVSFFDGVPFYVSQIQSSGNDDDVVFKLQALLGILLTPTFFLNKNKIIHAMWMVLYYGVMLLL